MSSSTVLGPTVGGEVEDAGHHLAAALGLIDGGVFGGDDVLYDGVLPEVDMQELQEDADVQCYDDTPEMESLAPPPNVGNNEGSFFTGGMDDVLAWADRSGLPPTTDEKQYHSRGGEDTSWACRGGDHTVKLQDMKFGGALTGSINAKGGAELSAAKRVSEIMTHTFKHSSAACIPQELKDEMLDVAEVVEVNVEEATEPAKVTEPVDVTEPVKPAKVVGGADIPECLLSTRMATLYDGEHEEHDWGAC